MKRSRMTEQQGKSEGGKEPPSRSIKQLFKLFKFEKLDGQRGEKTFSTRWNCHPVGWQFFIFLYACAPKKFAL